jgi:FAD synthase
LLLLALERISGQRNLIMAGWLVTGNMPSLNGKCGQIDLFIMDQQQELVEQQKAQVEMLNFLLKRSEEKNNG